MEKMRLTSSSVLAVKDRESVHPTRAVLMLVAE